MRIAISNIAWDVAEDEAVARLLGEHGVDAIDVAPGKYFPQPEKTSDEEIARVRDWWSERGIQIVGMQALLFGTAGMNVFGTAESRDAMLGHLSAICRIGSRLGATKLVFGSPKNRDRSGLDDRDAAALALSFFQRLGEIAQGHGVTVCLEPTPPCYGANFMRNSDETAHIVRAVAHPAIRMQLDTGALVTNGECAADVLARCAHLIGHVHASEPELAPLGDRGTDHRAMHSALVKFLPQHVLTIEMLATKSEPHLLSIKRALDFANSNYRSQQGAIG
ncbi:sugar phosphate isomerase/epimerase [Verminephrobacter aporrectodeae subsp. tuberculatae]|uniref:sugar phosphate isomerase/epimerase family protein n=1 Tax=Verminephrobacter aporrectodeae TaxID=1110389 RepID=UPI002238AFD9|nr:sugar phosphate isomerase/epimerase family protein [Verminephrobacter aporrectodeae]MCW5257238.1 sugar phosphate isomerase/epimerase [Verminephrobacter aporrectodeae subsp. tuberculatae]